VDTRNQQTGFPREEILGISRRFRYNGYKRPNHKVFGVVAPVRCSRSYKREFIREFNSYPCGGGVEYLHRDPASRRRRQKGSLISETVKYGLKSQGTRTRKRLRWQGPAAYTKDKPDLSSERAPHKNKTVIVTQVIKIWSQAPDGCFIPRQTGRLTVGRNIKLDSTRPEFNSVRDSFVREFRRQFYS
jgi:hypothetical protein